MSAAFAGLRSAAADVAADGTDPDQLATIVAFSGQPRVQPDVLRRRDRDGDRGRDRDGDCDRDRDGDRAGTIASRLTALAGPPTATTGAVAERLLATWRADAVRVALIGDPAYPRCLAEGWPELDAPVWLAWRGQPPGHAPGVAIVGARRATSYGSGVAAWLAEAVADAGIRVVSGGATGIDAAAHRATTGRPGGTTVVLGCGHRVAYPRPHARAGGLFDQILDDGGSLVSEALPHQPPKAHQIRARNRIVAGLAAAVVVVEGGERSGSLLTAGAAAERGRAVLAVPGDIRAPGSAAPHRLLAEGAAPCCSPAQLLEALGSSVPAAEHPGGEPGSGGGSLGGAARAATDAPAAGTVRATTTLPPAVHAALVGAWPRPVRLEDLARTAQVPVGGLLAALTRARVNGEVAEAADGIRLRRAPPDTG